MNSILKKISTTILALLMVFTVIGGYSKTVTAMENTELEDGEYEINIWAMRTDNENVSSADNDLLKPSSLTVIDGKMYAEITMKRADLLSDFSIANSNNEFELAEVISENLEGETSHDKTRTYRFEVEDIDNLVLAQVKVQTPIGTMTPQFRLVLERDTMVQIGADEPAEEPVTEEPVTEEPVEEQVTEEPVEEQPQPETPVSEHPVDEKADEDSLQDGIYTIQLKAIHESNENESMANQNIIKPARIEIVNGELYAIITMTNTHQMANLSVRNSDGEFVPVEILEENTKDNITTYRFLIANLEEPVMMQVDIPMAGMTVRFRLVFDETTLVEFTEHAHIQTPENPSDQETSLIPGENNSTNLKTDTINPQTGDNSYRIMITLIALVLITPMLLVGIDLFQKKITV